MKGHFAYLCPGCGGRNTEWEPFDQEIYEIHDDISGNISRIDGDIADIRLGRRCRDCGEGYVVDIRVDLDEGTCVYRSN